MGEHDSQIEIMKFLGRLAYRLGVGECTYVVGGAVRDWLTGHPLNDIDVVIDPTETAGGENSEWFASEIGKEIPVDTSYTLNRFGVAILTVKDDWTVAGHQMRGETIEVANTRRETYRKGEGKNYKPGEVEPAPLSVDVGRREFTVNTLMWKLRDLRSGPDEAKVLDPTGRGLRDLEEGVLRCPSCPVKTFEDDPSRMLRAVKFSLRFGFRIHEEAAAAIRDQAGELERIPHNAVSAILLNDIFEDTLGTETLTLLEDLALVEPIAEICRDTKAFKTTLNNWFRRNATPSFWIEAASRVDPLDGPLRFVEDRKLRSRAEMRMKVMEPRAGKAFREVLKQPGKVLDMPSLIRGFDLQGREIAAIEDTAREILVENPSLREKGTGFTRRVKEVFKASSGNP